MSESLAEKIKRRRQEAAEGLKPGAAAANKRHEKPAAPRENIQREVHGPLDLANEYARLINENGLTQIQLAKKLGVSQGWISKKLSLLTAPQDIQDKIQRGEIAETVLYNDKDGAQDSGEASTERVKTITVPRGQILEVAKLIRDVTVKYGLPEVELSKKPTKAELLAVLSRIKDIKGLILR